MYIHECRYIYTFMYIFYILLMHLFTSWAIYSYIPAHSVECIYIYTEVS